MARYVGKRIVPKHCGYWDNTNEYEMESVVYDRASGNSYISRKTVPVGTDISQTEYWALCSDFNMQMDLLEQHFTATEQRIKADNDATEAAINADNQATKEYVDSSLEQTTETLTATVTRARTEMAQQKNSFDQTASALNTRMDAILAAGTGDGATEVLDGRVDHEGKTHASLGEAIRTSDASLKSQRINDSAKISNGMTWAATGEEPVSWQSGYIANGANGSVGDWETVVEDADYECCTFAVNPGEKYEIIGTGGASPRRLLIELKADNTQYAVSGSKANWQGIEPYTVTRNGARLVMNARKDSFHAVYKVSSPSIPTRVTALESADTAMDTRVTAIESANTIFDVSSAKSIVLLGDSIVQGVGSSDFSATGEDLNTSVHATKRNVGAKAWGSQFVNLMTSKYGCTCVDNGVSQFTIDNLTANLDVLLPTGTDYCLVMIGKNNRSNSDAGFTTSMNKLLNAIKAKGVTPYVFSVIPLNGATGNVEKKQQLMRNACTAQNVPFFPLYSEFQAYVSMNGISLSTLYADSLHPNDRGHEVMFGIIRQDLQI